MSVRVVAAVAGEQRSLAGLPWAARLAQVGGGLEILSVAEPGGGDERARWLRTRPEVGDVNAEVTVREGDPAEVITAAARSEQDTVVCMATRGRGPWREALLGSVSGEVLRKAGRPVLLVGPRAAPPPVDATLGRVVATLDGSAMSEVALPVASSWAHRFDADIRLLAVVYPLVDPAARVVTALPPEAKAVYTKVGERSRELQEGGLDADWWVVAHEDPGATIADHVRLAPSWLLVMATHGHTGLARVLVGSVTTEVVRRHTGPVLVIRSERLGE